MNIRYTIYERTVDGMLVVPKGTDGSILFGEEFFSTENDAISAIESYMIDERDKQFQMRGEHDYRHMPDYIILKSYGWVY